MIVLIALLLALATEVATYSYDSTGLSTQLGFLADGLLVRMRRHPTRSSTLKTLSADELAGVKDALQQMMPKRNLDDSVSTTTIETVEVTAARTSVAGGSLKIVIDSAYDGDPSSTTDTNTEDDGNKLSQHTQTKLGDTGLDYEYEDSKTVALNPTRTSKLNLTKDELSQPPLKLLRYPPDTTTDTATTSTTRRTRRSKTTAMRIDIAKLMALVSNLTMSYQAELALLLNKSLEQYTIPTCPTPTSTETTPVGPTTTDMYGNLTGTIMGKCFVCGLDDKEMPRNAHCSDAFAGDFIPLVPMNPQAKAHIAKYRKYCRWMNIPRYYINASEPRSMWGRWTGGCSVRWIDVTGVYTQRTCRNRHRATMGKHWVSKRMAKLEMALQHIDNGCIISPMASLVPLSRGISMYARFHACVCTGNWCNSSMGLYWNWSYIAWTIGVLLRYLT